MKYRNFLLEKTMLILLVSLYGSLFGKELHRDTTIAKSGGHHGGGPRGGRTRIRINIAPIYTDYDSDYRDYEDDYSGCIPYYYHYGYPPSAFNFGLRMRRGGAYYYCPSGYYYNRSRYRDSRNRHIDRGRGRHRH